MKTTKQLVPIAIKQLETVTGGYVHIPGEELPPELKKKNIHFYK